MHISLFHSVQAPLDGHHFSVPKFLMEQCKAFIANGKVIDAIKAFRAETGCSIQNVRRALEL
ncbi:hypothetical protein [Pseudomonas kurunegalensis]|uniref:hypothetical protein n=1 Tax=Pseudomonas kurunegalensis TaxID=485880 RepID=UPI00326194D4